MTRATWPAKNRSWASARRDGRTPHQAALGRPGPRRPSPRPCSGCDRRVGRRVPPRARRPVVGTVAGRPARRRAGRAGRRAAAAGRSAVIASQRSMIARGPRVGGPGLGLLLVGHRHHPQGEDLVDLGGVEQRAGALRRDCRVVVQDDRRAEHTSSRPAAPASTGQQRCCAAAARRPRPPRRAGRAARRSRASCGLEQQVRADQRDAGSPSSLSVGRSGRASLSTATVSRTQPSSPAPAPTRSTRRPSGHRRRTSRPTGAPCVRSQLGSTSSPPGDVDRQVAPCAGRRARRPSSASSRSTASSQREPPRRRRRAARRPASNPVAASSALRPRGAGAAGTAGARSTGRPRRRRRAAGTARHRRLLADAGVGGTRRAEHAELPARPGSSPSWRGRGRAGSPRRARRRRPRGPRSRLMARAHPTAPRRGQQGLRRSRPSVVRPCAGPVVGQRVERRRGRSRSQPVPGKYDVHQLAARPRPAAGSAPRSPTASARRRSRCAPRVKTVPQNSSASGTSPSRSGVQVLRRR